MAYAIVMDETLATTDHAKRWRGRTRLGGAGARKRGVTSLGVTASDRTGWCGAANDSADTTTGVASIAITSSGRSGSSCFQPDPATDQDEAERLPSTSAVGTTISCASSWVATGTPFGVSVLPQRPNDAVRDPVTVIPRAVDNYTTVSRRSG